MVRSPEDDDSVGDGELVRLGVGGLDVITDKIAVWLLAST
jgi:hypothetical protein